MFAVVKRNLLIVLDDKYNIFAKVAAGTNAAEH